MSAAQNGVAAPRKSFAQVAAAAHRPVQLPPRETPDGVASDAKETKAPENGHVAGKQPVPALPRAPSQVVVDADGENVPIPAKSTAAQAAEASRAPSIAPSEPGHLHLDGLQRRENSDTKSVASRTTLTLDEKESLRPDDSASVQAAVEEDSSAGSRVGSTTDTDARAFRDQLHEIERNGPARYVAHRNLPLNLPRSGQQSGPISFGTASGPVLHTPAALEVESARQSGEASPVHVLPPDEKLLEALASPKDRLFVLKIEQDMIDFVKDSKENFLQLPQTNSFYRMLSHKLADYYCLSHVVDESLTSVRIYRTPHCRLPPPLIGPDPTTGSSTPPPTAPARKIMRRGDLEQYGANVADSTRNTSKTTSELDGSGSDDNQKDKAAMTREQRENRYKEARARIFKDFKEGSATPGEMTPASNEPADHSRSSSRSGLRKSKKTRKPKDDTFEARSAYSQFPNQHFAPTMFQTAQPDPLYSAFASLNVSGPFTAYPQGYQPMTPPYGDGSMGPQQPQPQQQQHQQQQQQHWYSHPNQQQYAMPQPMASPGPCPVQQHEGQVQGVYPGYSTYPSGNQATPKPSVPSLAYGTPNYQQVQGQNLAWLPPQYGQMYNMQPVYNGRSPGTGNMAYGYQAQPPDMSFAEQQSRGHFNPNSQTFVPSLPGSGGVGGSGVGIGVGVGGVMAVPGPYGQGQHYQPMQHHNTHGSAGGSRHTANTVMQRQPSNMSQASSFAQGPAQAQQSHQGQHHTGPSTISKWANSPSLPSKPPAPASSLAFQVPPNSMGKQPLPLNPMAASTALSHGETSGGGRALA